MYLELSGLHLSEIWKKQKIILPQSQPAKRNYFLQKPIQRFLNRKSPQILDLREFLNKAWASLGGGCLSLMLDFKQLAWVSTTGEHERVRSRLIPLYRHSKNLEVFKSPLFSSTCFTLPADGSRKGNFLPCNYFYKFSCINFYKNGYIGYIRQ